MKKIRIILFFLFICNFNGLLFAQTIDPPWSWVIISDFGPRNVNPPASWFHPGIDYDGPEGTGINPVEDGTIPQIRYGGGWHIDVSGNNGVWMYIHIFSGDGTSSPPRSGNWELIKDATLVDPNNEDNLRTDNIIILWSGTRAEKVLSSIPDFWAKDSSGNYILGTGGNKIKTRNSVIRSEVIAPVGTSGYVEGPHLHLQLYTTGYGRIFNPLYHLRHPPDNLPTVTIKNPENNHVFIQEELDSNYPIKVYIDSHGASDLDKITFWVYKNKDPNQAIRLGTDPTFGYGGRPTENKTSSVIEYNGSTAGVQSTKDVAGEDTFIFLQKFRDLNLPDGEHSLVIKAIDVNGHPCPDTLHRFKIDTTRPSLQIKNLMTDDFPTGFWADLIATDLNGINKIYVKVDNNQVFETECNGSVSFNLANKIDFSKDQAGQSAEFIAEDLAGNC